MKCIEALLDCFLGSNEHSRKRDLQEVLDEFEAGGAGENEFDEIGEEEDGFEIDREKASLEDIAEYYERCVFPETLISIEFKISQTQQSMTAKFEDLRAATLFQACGMEGLEVIPKHMGSTRFKAFKERKWFVVTLDLENARKLLDKKPKELAEAVKMEIPDLLESLGYSATGGQI